MTYCIAASIDEGLVLVSDSRTNAGIDNVSTYGKMHVFDTTSDRFLTLQPPLDNAARCCLVSMNSTTRSNASVGPPIEMLIYRKDSYSLDEYFCFEDGDEYMLNLRRTWENNLRKAFAELPRLNKESNIHKLRADL